MNLLIQHIKALVFTEDEPKPFYSGKEMTGISLLKNAWLYIEGSQISDFGVMDTLPESYKKASQIIDATDRFVFPSYCDSHTHLVYPESREIEYVNKIKGLSYEEIAKQGGGILNSAKKWPKKQKMRFLMMRCSA